MLSSELVQGLGHTRDARARARACAPERWPPMVKPGHALDLLRFIFSTCFKSVSL